MLPDPLHPAVVHIPIALALLIPLLAIVVWVVIQRGLLPARSWAALVLLQALLVASAWAAIETGEHEEERVERVVAERHIEEHEEKAEVLITIAAVALLVMGAGLVSGPSGALLRGAGVVASIGVLVAAAAVGHSGGELVYVHGAAGAYTEGTGPNVASGPERGDHESGSGDHDRYEDDDDDDDHH